MKSRYSVFSLDPMGNLLQHYYFSEYEKLIAYGAQSLKFMNFNQKDRLHKIFYNKDLKFKMYIVTFKQCDGDFEEHSL